MTKPFPFLRRCALFFLLLLAIASPAATHTARAANSPDGISEQALLNHLEQITAWQRSVLALETTPNNALEKLLKDSLQRNAGRVLQYGFEFGRAQAAIMAGQKKEMVTVENPATSSNQIANSISDITLRIESIQKEQADLSARINRTPRRNQAPLLIQREQLASELKIAQARQDLLKSLVNLYGTDETKDADDILAKIDNLSMTIPGAAPKKKSTKTDSAKTDSGTAAAVQATTGIVLPGSNSTATADAPAEAAAPSRTLVGTITDIFSVYRKKRELTGMIAETSALHDSNLKMIHTLRDVLQDAVKRGNELTKTLNSADRDTIQAQRTQIDAIVGQFKQLSVAVVPLGQVNLWLEASERNLEEWSGALDTQLARMTGTLLWQVVLLTLAILIPLMLSEAARRAIRRYVRDNKRQRQLHIARKIVFILIVLLIILLNLVTEFSSLATFIGFLTAGMAVALQNVILSAVAHFFYFGRFGVRTGDRVTIKGVTGEVVQVGVIRLYMMELGGTESERYPTGRIVSFPNSILFQSEAFSKQITGADYTWQEITFILDPESDYDLANKKLNEAVNVVYMRYHDVMEKQKMAMTRSTHLNVTMPSPKGFLSFVPDGLAFVIRYPIQSDHVAEINQRITKEILATIQKEPSMKLASTKPPKIESVDMDDPAPEASTSSSSED